MVFSESASRWKQKNNMKKEILRFYLNFRLYIFPVVSALSCLILIVFVIYPQTAKLIKNQKEQGDLIAKSKFMEAKASTLDSLDEGDLTQKVGYVLTAYPLEADFPNVVGLLQRVAAQNDFSVITLSVNPGSKTSGEPQKYDVKLETVGPESLLPRFITSIEASLRIMRVVSIEISPAKEGNITNAALEIEALYAQAPSSFGGPASPLPELSQADEELIAQLAAYGISKPSTISVPSQPSAQQPRGKSDPFE